ncbi:ATP-dependent protease La (LON) domain [Seminavis robusta]|uniref:ATP-dependent protease La (LON) domain n=1 Tax=Seminavis robusta TaxID=568900 RepID=A0A9N8EXA1_9STRA|nr:ATP-dependent protease La (LON) domain [Seminavis robusta]|eukprot:Sro1826_g300130.1 ATP-dependent protease La (LON) domain (320) ;mRNA; f:11593-12552
MISSLRIRVSWMLLLSSSSLLSLFPCADAFLIIGTVPWSHVSSTGTCSSSSSWLRMSSDSDSDDFMKSLQSRMAQVEDSDSKLPIVVLDTMLPRQVLKIEVENDIFQALVKDCVERESLRFGMIGTATLANTGQSWPLQNGVEVEIVDPPQVVDGQLPADGGNNKALRVKLQAGRRFRIDQKDLQTNPAGWTEARVEWLNEETEEPEDPLSMARAIHVCVKITKRNLIDQWVELAKTKEHFEGQIDQLLEDLGELPPVEEPSELAFWVGALVNPLPAMGVAMEIRPQLLMAKTAEERIGTAYKGLIASIAHMDGTKPLF